MSAAEEEKPQPPPAPERDSSGSPDRTSSLLTSKDIFGDILDALPVEGPPPPPSLAPARRGPIKVQVSEALAKGTASAPAPEPSPTADVLPDDVAALLDAFSGPAEEAERAAATAPPGPEPPDLAAPEPRPEPPPPEAVSEAEPPAPPQAEAIVDDGLQEVVDLLNDAERLLASDRRGHPGPEDRDALEDLLQLRLPTELRRRGDVAARSAAPPPPPATRFQASPPREAEGAAVDLAALAEEALAQAAPPSPAAEAGSRYGPYLLIRREATGGMAEVWRAKRSGVEGFEKVVALKRILPHLSDNKEFVDMFIDEAKMVAGLAHPNIVQIFDLGRLERSYYIAMEFVQGHDLRTIMRRARERGMRLPLDLSVLIASRVCLALEFAHRKRDDQGQPMMIVHRDVSPQNILISLEGEVKLTDFGIAKAATKASITDAGALRGKLLYMSPEQAWGKPLDRRSDIFSLGLVLYEMITDNRPFMAGTETSILEAVRQCQIASPTSLNPRIPERLEEVVMMALQREPDYRYQDAGEMYRGLERVLHERQPLPADALSHFMRTLVDAEAPPAAAEPAPAPAAEPAPVEDEDIELEFESDQEAPPEPEPPPVEPSGSSIQKLLRKFGLK
jgi:serine/threonine protein kinase